jgi:hypothetical protein
MGLLLIRSPVSLTAAASLQHSSGPLAEKMQADLPDTNTNKAQKEQK